MLGTAGTIAAEIFVLTGYAAGVAGPDAVLALIIGGILSLSIALNYCELATTYPVTGGAMTYVREAFGNNLSMFLVGSFDCLSSTFYAALSAIGFAYSLKVFLPFLPIIPVALLLIIFVGILHIRGISQVGKLQVILGAFLLGVFGLYVALGLSRPEGFSWEVFYSGRQLFENQSVWANLSRMLMTIALIYNAYVGFEVIADDAEEIINPHRNIPIGILTSLGITTLVYSLVSFVTIGVIPYTALAGSETALTDAAQVFWPRFGVPLLGLAGIVATLTSINSAMLSATREAFTLSRDQVWPRSFSRLSQRRTPYVAIVFVVLASALVAIIGRVDFLSFISSAGYMFVLIWTAMAMIALRKKYPNVERPFKVPFFPATAYLAAASGLLIIPFVNPQALLFLGILIVLLSVTYYLSIFLKRRRSIHEKLEEDIGGGRILVAAANPKTAVGLVKLAARLAEHQEDTAICLLSVHKSPSIRSDNEIQEIIQKSKLDRKNLLKLTAPIAQACNVPIYTKLRVASNVETAIYQEIRSRNPVNLVLLGWPGEKAKAKQLHNIIKEVALNARKDVGILKTGDIQSLNHILIPVGNGPNTPLALRMGKAIAYREKTQLTALHIIQEQLDDEQIEDQTLLLSDIIENELGEIPAIVSPKILSAPTVVEGILAEINQHTYDLIIIGSGMEVFSPRHFFGQVVNHLVEEIATPLLIVRRYQTEPTLWLQNRIKQIEDK